jgi:hypothetical protein
MAITPPLRVGRIDRGVHDGLHAGVAKVFFVFGETGEDASLTAFDVAAQRFDLHFAALRDVNNGGRQVPQQRCRLVKGVLALSGQFVFVGGNAVKDPAFARCNRAAVLFQVIRAGFYDVLKQGFLCRCEARKQQS